MNDASQLSYPILVCAPRGVPVAVIASATQQLGDSVTSRGVTSRGIELETIAVDSAGRWWRLVSVKPFRTPKWWFSRVPGALASDLQWEPTQPRFELQQFARGVQLVLEYAGEGPTGVIEVMVEGDLTDADFGRATNWSTMIQDIGHRSGSL